MNLVFFCLVLSLGFSRRRIGFVILARFGIGLLDDCEERRMRDTPTLLCCMIRCIMCICILYIYTWFGELNEVVGASLRGFAIYTRVFGGFCGGSGKGLTRFRTSYASCRIHLSYMSVCSCCRRKLPVGKNRNYCCPCCPEDAEFSPPAKGNFSLSLAVGSGWSS